MAAYTKNVGVDELVEEPLVSGVNGGAVTINVANGGVYVGGFAPYIYSGYYQGNNPVFLSGLNYGDSSAFSADISNTTIGAINLNAARNAVIMADIAATSGGVGPVAVKVNDGGYVSATVFASGAIGATSINANGDSTTYLELINDVKDGVVGNIGPISVNANGADSYAFVYADANQASIGAISLNSKTDGSAEIWAYASAGLNAAGAAQGGNIGAVTLKSTGAYAYTSAYVRADGVFNDGDPAYKAAGNIGPLSLSATGYNSSAYVYASAFSGGSIGTINANANGYSSWIDVYASAQTGNVGAITVNAKGTYASAYVDVSAYAGMTSAATPAVIGGNVGAINAKAIGTYADVYVSAYADGVFNDGDTAFRAAGNIGAVNVSATGYDASAYVEAESYSGGNIGPVTLAANGAYTGVSGYIYAGLGNVGTVSLATNGLNASTDFSAYAYAGLTGAATPTAIGGNIGAVTIRNVGDDADVSGYLRSDGVFSDGNATFKAAGNIGPINVTNTGWSASAHVDAYAYSGGNIGAMTIRNTGTSAYIDAYAYADMGNVGALTLNTTGVSASAYVGLYANAGDTTASTPTTVGGNIGNIIIRANGDQAYTQVSAYANGTFQGYSSGYAGDAYRNAGNIGSIALTQTGYSSYAYVSAASYSGGNIGTITATINGNSAYTDVSAYAQYGSIGAITVSTTGNYAYANVDAYASAGLTDTGTQVGGGNIGAVTLNANGTSAYVYGDLRTSGTYSAGEVYHAGGNIGNISVNANGIESYAFVSAAAYSGGNIGNITVTAKGVYANAGVSAYAEAGNIGNVINAAIGDGAYVSAYIDAIGRLADGGVSVGGNVGTVTQTVTGDWAAVYTSVNNVYVSGLSGVGNVGNITANVNGTGASSYVEAYALNGGNIGNVVLNVKGTDASSEAYLYAEDGGDIGTVNATVQAGLSNVHYASAYVGATVIGAENDLGKIGATTFNVNNVNSDDNGIELNYNAYNGGAIGNITGSINGGISGYASIYASAYAGLADVGGTIGNIAITNTSEGGYIALDLTADNSVGTITANATGAGNSITGIFVSGYAETVGAITVALGTGNSGFAGGIGVQAGDADVGLIKVTGGSATSFFAVGIAGANMSAGPQAVSAYSVAGIDLSLYNGRAYIDVTEVVEGTTIKGGKAGSTIYATQADDTITGGVGSDFILGNLGADIINLGVDAVADAVVYAGLNDGANSGFNGVADGYDLVSNFKSADDDVLIAYDLLAAIDKDDIYDVDVTEVAPATATSIDTETTELAFVAKDVNTGASAVTAVNLNDTAKVAALLEAAIGEITDSGDVIIDGTETTMFAIESSDVAGTFGIYSWTQSGVDDVTIDAAELKVIGIVTGDAVAASDFVAYAVV